jgi:hypothetical protein
MRLDVRLSELAFVPEGEVTLSWLAVVASSMNVYEASPATVTPERVTPPLVMVPITPPVSVPDTESSLHLSPASLTIGIGVHPDAQHTIETRTVESSR